MIELLIGIVCIILVFTFWRIFLGLALVLALIVALNGCASMTEAERFTSDYNEQVARNNWFACQTLYERSNVAWQSRHVHTRGKPHRLHEVEDDLMYNGCRRALGGRWEKGL